MRRLEEVALEEALEAMQSPRPLPEPLQIVEPNFQEFRRESLNGNYETGFELGRGASGRVIIAQERGTGRYVAIKLIKKSGLQPEQLVRIRREYAIMKHIEHKNWVKLVEVIENPEEICIVMEYASCGDLYTHIISSPNMRLSEKDARGVFYQMAEGVLHLHRCGFIHRDIKPENILLGKKNHVLIADLGYGTIWEKDKLTNTPCGSLYYASPEIVKHDGVYIGPEVDVWSLGAVLYVMTCGRLPFQGKTADTTRKLIIKGEYALPYHLSTELKNLINGMLEIDPCKRLNMEQVIVHEWTTGGKKKPPKRGSMRRRSFGSSFASFAHNFRVWSPSTKVGEENAMAEEPGIEKTGSGEGEEKTLEGEESADTALPVVEELSLSAKFLKKKRRNSTTSMKTKKDKGKKSSKPTLAVIMEEGAMESGSGSSREMKSPKDRENDKDKDKEKEKKKKRWSKEVKEDTAKLEEEKIVLQVGRRRRGTIF